MIKSILIANRGEIAIRIAKTSKKMGIKTFGIYSEQDKESLHLSYCDEAISLGSDPLKGSYLNIKKIIDLAKNLKIDAVHPGYGFLSENYEFARKLQAKNIHFIGPPHNAIKAMGDKIESKKIAKKAGVNCIPGVNKEIKNLSEANEYADIIGFPIMIKASAGGGGKGMRIAKNKKDFQGLITLAKEEAKNAFGDDRVFLEKYIEIPRHIEIQILGDKFGNIVWIGDRECSIQRRHQKIIEEAPSSFIDDITRKKMGEQSILLAKEVGYYSAGTVEFVMDKNRNFYFLEMNTRLQVEHPVTEETANIDLVEEMINVANGKKIKIKQENVRINGWSFESRLCAENPLKDFLPSAGRISAFRIHSKDVRLDSGYKEGDTVSIYYDSLLAKIIAKGKDREEARKKMLIALENSDIRGIETNLDFLISIFTKKQFISGDINTNFISNTYLNGYQGSAASQKDTLIMAIFILFNKLNYLLEVSNKPRNISKKWYICFKNKNFLLKVLNMTEEKIEILLENKIFKVKKVISPNYSIKRCIINEKEEIAKIFKIDNKYKIYYKGNFEVVEIYKFISYELLKKLPKNKKRQENSQLVSPMPGKVIEIKIQKGEAVEVGDPLIILDAMKMQNVLKSEARGVVKDILVNEGDSVVYEQTLIIFGKKN